MRNLSGISMAKFKFQKIWGQHSVTTIGLIKLWTAVCTLFGVTFQLGLEIREKHMSVLLLSPPPSDSLARAIAVDVDFHVIFKC